MDEGIGFLSAASFREAEGPLSPAAMAQMPFVFWLADALRPRRFAVAATDDGPPPLPLAEAVRHAGNPATGPAADGPVDLLLLSIGSDAERAAASIEAWLPRLSDEGVILLHGTAGADGSPSAAFRDLAADRPSFLFPHGLGLGVVAAGLRRPEGLDALFGADRATSGAIRATYAALGATMAERGAGKDAALRFAATAKRALTAHHGRTRRRLAETERAAAAARSRVERLAGAAGARHAEEYAARDALLGALARVGALVDEHRRRPAGARGPKDLVRLGPLRRWIGRARAYAGLLDGAADAAAALSAAQTRYDEGRRLRIAADGEALAAEPRASALEGAAATLRDGQAETERILASLADLPSDGTMADDDYARWVERYDTLTDRDRVAIRERVAALGYRPLISVLVPVYDPPVAVLRQTIASVRAQLYPDWELCMADDASTDPAVLDALERAAAEDPRIKVVRRSLNGHISAASNSALALATGEFVALLDHDDLLSEHALYEVAVALNDDPDVDLIYSDEDHIGGDGHRFDPYFKPDYNPDLMTGHNLVNHLGVYRRSLAQAVGGFRLGYEGSQDYDLALRVVDATQPRRIRHIPAVLYHWRSAAADATFSEAFLERCLASGRRALQDHLARRGEAGKVEAHPDLPQWHRVRRPVPDPAPLVSVIVPTKDGATLLRPCCDGILRRTDYPAIELIVVDHASTEPETLDLLAELGRDPRVRVLSYAGPFNYAEINNVAVAAARGSILALLNNDVDVIRPDWLAEMVALAELPDVGAVGARLLYPDGHVQHAGILLGQGGVAGHMLHGLGRHEPGASGRALMTAAVSAVTAACLVVRKAVFDEVGGFDAEHLPVAFNDVDLCLRIGRGGYRNVWCAHAELFHHESVSRGSDEVPERIDAFRREFDVMKQRWGDLLRHDPAYNPNLDLEAGDFSLAFPPRRGKPWATVADDADPEAEGRVVSGGVAAREP